MDTVQAQEVWLQLQIAIKEIYSKVLLQTSIFKNENISIIIFSRMHQTCPSKNCIENTTTYA